MFEKRIDFLIIYESKVRELEAACLLKMELMRRGYSVSIEYVHSYRKLKLRPKVIITPYLYSDLEVKELAHCGEYFVNKIINLQWEQILSDDENSIVFHSPKNGSETAVHLAWGENNVSFLRKANVVDKNIFAVGNMNMDFCSEKFESFFETKREIANKYSIDENKKWLLFISSFAINNDYVYEQLNATFEENEKRREFRKFSISSQKGILNWFEKLLNEDSDICIIYRPHPAEMEDDKIQEFVRSNSRFYCIQEASVRQWISVSDVITTWYSTSIVDSFFMKKTCMILRPIEIPKGHEVKVMGNGIFTTQYESFLAGVNEDTACSLQDERVNEFYGRTIGNAYSLTADVCEKVINSEEYVICGDYPREKNSLKYCIYLKVLSICQYIKISKIFRSRRREFENVEKNTFGARKAERRICRRISGIFEKIY